MDAIYQTHVQHLTSPHCHAQLLIVWLRYIADTFKYIATEAHWQGCAVYTRSLVHSLMRSTCITDTSLRRPFRSGLGLIMISNCRREHRPWVMYCIPINTATPEHGLGATQAVNNSCMQAGEGRGSKKALFKNTH